MGKHHEDKVVEEPNGQISQLVMVSNRLPVDKTVNEDGTVSWEPSPGGLVTAVEPIVQKFGCVWVGWPGGTGSAEDMDPVQLGQMQLVPVALSEEDVEEYYEGFSNGTLWPLYHDVIAQPVYHRVWWLKYREINRRFAEAVAAQAAQGATVWVHDYQLQLVPQMLREMRPDVKIGFFLHIPFPARRLYAQLPWRRAIVNGLLGADVVGFQTVQDAESFRSSAETFCGAHSHGNLVMVQGGKTVRSVIAQEFPISIDAEDFARMAGRSDIQERAAEIREELGGRKVVLGVDRLDYTKGIRHRLKAYGELLSEGEVDPATTVLVQVATPSRERVDAYQELRDQVEVTVSRINGDFGTLEHSPIVYLHQGFSREEMVALYLVADLVVVTSLRDGMNLVAKEYAACRLDNTGVLLLSEFAGAKDELKDALLVNPHDIEGLKAAIVRGLHMPAPEQRRRMVSLKQAVADNDVAHWADNFLSAIAASSNHGANEEDDSASMADTYGSRPFVPRSLDAALRRLATVPNLLVVCDFDGTLAPFTGDPSKSRMLGRANDALKVLSAAQGVTVALVSGRALDSLREVGLPDESWILSGSHGAELSGIPTHVNEKKALSRDEASRLARLERRLERVFGEEVGVRLERKPFGVAVHTRQVADDSKSEELLQAASALASEWGIELRTGKQVREFSIRRANKGEALGVIRAEFPEVPVLFFGDDATDEDVFEVLGTDDVGVKVGEGETLANERVADPDTVAAALAILAEYRTGVVVGDTVEQDDEE